MQAATRIIPPLLLLTLLVCAPAMAESAVPPSLESLVEIAVQTAAALDIDVDLRYSEAGLVAFPTGWEENALVGQEPAEAFLIYQFLADGSGTRFRVGYVFGRISMLGAPRGLERPYEIHQTLMTRLRKAGIRLAEVEDLGLPPDEFMQYADELRNGDGVTTEPAPETSVPASSPERECEIEGPEFVFTGHDDDEALIRLERFLKDSGLTVKSRSGNLVGVERKGTLIILQVKTAKAGLDRLIATVAFLLRDVPDDGTVAAIVSKLNEMTSGVKYFGRPDGLIVQTQIGFVDRLSLTHLEASLDFMVAMQLATLVATPELIGLLKS